MINTNLRQSFIFYLHLRAEYKISMVLFAYLPYRRMEKAQLFISVEHLLNRLLIKLFILRKHGMKIKKNYRINQRQS